MIKLPLVVFCVSIFLSYPSMAQKYYPIDLIQQRVTINSADCTETAFTKPIKASVFPSAAKNYYWYSANKIKFTQGGYSGKLLNGLYNSFYLNKNLKENGYFKNGLKHGRWHLWLDNGFLKESLVWRLGTLTGKFYKYDQHGKVLESGFYKRGLISGPVKSFSDTGKVHVVYFKAGKPVLRKNHLRGIIPKWMKKKPTEEGVLK